MIGSTFELAADGLSERNPPGSCISREAHDRRHIIIGRRPCPVTSRWGPISRKNRPTAECTQGPAFCLSFVPRIRVPPRSRRRRRIPLRMSAHLGPMQTAGIQRRVCIADTVESDLMEGSAPPNNLAMMPRRLSPADCASICDKGSKGKWNVS